MNGILMRVKMHHCLKFIEKACDSSELDVCTGDELNKICSNKGNLKAIAALSSGGYITAPCCDGAKKPSYIIANENLPMYFVERSEIWMNRILGFIAGVGTAFLTEFIVRTFL